MTPYPDRDSSRIRHLVVLLLASIGLASWSGCSSPDPNACTKGEFSNHCEGNVAVTCERPSGDNTGYGSIGASDKIERTDCGSDRCGTTVFCEKDCDICAAKQTSGIGCIRPKAPPPNCSVS